MSTRSTSHFHSGGSLSVLDKHDDLLIGAEICYYYLCTNLGCHLVPTRKENCLIGWFLSLKWLTAIMKSLADC